MTKTSEKIETYGESEELARLRNALNRLYAWRDHAEFMSRQVSDEEAVPYRNQVANYQAVIDDMIPAVKTLEKMDLTSWQKVMISESLRAYTSRKAWQEDATQEAKEHANKLIAKFY